MTTTPPIPPTPPPPPHHPTPDNSHAIPNDEQLEAMLAELGPTAPSPGVAKRIEQSLEDLEDGSAMPGDVVYRFGALRHPVMRGAIAAGILVIASVGVMLNQEELPNQNRPTAQRGEVIDYPILTGAPTLFAYHQAMRQSPEALEALLDQPRLMVSSQPLSPHSSMIDIE